MLNNWKLFYWAMSYGTKCKQLTSNLFPRVENDINKMDMSQE